MISQVSNFQCTANKILDLWQLDRALDKRSEHCHRDASNQRSAMPCRRRRRRRCRNTDSQNCRRRRRRYRVTRRVSCVTRYDTDRGLGVFVCGYSRCESGRDGACIEVADLDVCVAEGFVARAASGCYVACAAFALTRCRKARPCTRFTALFSKNLLRLVLTKIGTRGTQVDVSFRFICLTSI